MGQNPVLPGMIQDFIAENVAISKILPKI